MAVVNKPLTDEQRAQLIANGVPEYIVAKLKGGQFNGPSREEKLQAARDRLRALVAKP